MVISEVKNLKAATDLREVEDYIIKLNSCTNKKQVSNEIVNILYRLLNPLFVSYVVQEDSNLRVLSQSGEKAYIKDIHSLFTRKISEDIYTLVSETRKTISMNFLPAQNFLFVPVVDRQLDQQVEIHGMLVIYLGKTNLTFNKDINSLVRIVCQYGALTISNISSNKKITKIERSTKSLLQESSSVQKLHSAFMNKTLSPKLSYSILEDSECILAGDVWWIGNLANDMALIFTAKIHSNGMSSQMITGYLLGVLNNLKSNAEISLNPSLVLQKLNSELNSAFKESGITVDAFYGVLNLDARKLTFASSNYISPFLIGAELQISRLFNYSFSQPLGVNPNNTYEQKNIFIPFGSRLVIINPDICNEVSKVNNRHDGEWINEILEASGSLSLSEMKDSLDNLLPKNIPGTAHIVPRLALILELPPVMG